ncbi:beta-galactosidase [Paenibacillus sp.]|uniref:beta-galactosidase n=1 Tax=Paenibacillus sp. TaxID=58172 RepID=UPI002D585290|nr:beta-galactosidase [Paenibacillus sp.]HZG86702.1 beta-galactosidase [Paenibacillus sp.]
MNKTELPQLPYGSVYFRKSNPPEADWERDYAQAQADGMNMFRHWFLWGAIETAPDRYDWDDYDRQLDLAARNGIKTIIAEMITSVPEWMAAAHPDAVYRRSDGTRLRSQMGVSSATGGFGSGTSGLLCLDHPVARERAGRFLTALAERYKDHPSVVGYDVWNECNYAADICYCEHTKERFRAWLERKYGDLAALNRSWRRYSYTAWEQIEPPVTLAPYPECADWLHFKREHFYEQMQWRIDLLRKVDSRSWITAHGIAGSVNQLALAGADDWEAASRVDLYGFTWVASRKGNEPWKQWHAVDLVRSASRGKPFWHAEAQGGPLWLQPQVVGRTEEDGRIADPEDLRVWQMISFAGGARGLLFPRWRPLLDGPLFGAFGPYGMDGAPTKRSETASKIAKWANAPARKELWESAPVKGEIGILLLPDSQVFDALLNAESRDEHYSHAAWGAYQAFFDGNVQADWIRLEQIDDYQTVYLPYPIMMTEAAAETLSAWVHRGGTLISEGCPAYFGEGGRVGTMQPNYGLTELFGAVETDVQFMPDRFRELTFGWNGNRVYGGVYKQTFRPTTGRTVGRYGNGCPAVIENSWGAGRTLLIGTFPSAAYYHGKQGTNATFFANVLEWAGVVPTLRIAGSGSLQARMSSHPSGDMALWIVNSGRTPADAEIQVTLRNEQRRWSLSRMHWGSGEHCEQRGDALRVHVPARDALVVWLTMNEGVNDDPGADADG